jgi:hypothetical protein
VGSKKNAGGLAALLFLRRKWGGETSPWQLFDADLKHEIFENTGFKIADMTCVLKINGSEIIPKCIA